MGVCARARVRVCLPIFVCNRVGLRNQGECEGEGAVRVNGTWGEGEGEGGGGPSAQAR